MSVRYPLAAVVVVVVVAVTRAMEGQGLMRVVAVLRWINVQTRMLVPRRIFLELRMRVMAT